MLGLSLITVVLASVSALAAPAGRTCSLDKAKLNLPANQTLLIAPDQTPSFVSFAIGVQNYTCADTGKYTSIGAVAELYDASCLVGTPLFDNVQDIAFRIWNSLPKAVTAQEVITAGSKLGGQLSSAGLSSVILGQHYFVANPSGTGAAVPKWDFTSSGKTTGNTDAYVIGSKTGNIASPKGSTENVDWLSLKAVQGKLATQIFRTDTVSGQPPASCTPGSPNISVKYASKYWFYGSSL
jgi:hypothetical protein